MPFVCVRSATLYRMHNDSATVLKYSATMLQCYSANVQCYNATVLQFCYTVLQVKRRLDGMYKESCKKCDY